MFWEVHNDDDEQTLRPGLEILVVGISPNSGIHGGIVIQQLERIHRRYTRFIVEVRDEDLSTRYPRRRGGNQITNQN